MRISDWSSDVCSSDLCGGGSGGRNHTGTAADEGDEDGDREGGVEADLRIDASYDRKSDGFGDKRQSHDKPGQHIRPDRSEEHTSELQSLMRTSYAVFCLKKKIKHTYENNKNKLHDIITIYITIY